MTASRPEGAKELELIERVDTWSREPCEEHYKSFRLRQECRQCIAALCVEYAREQVETQPKYGAVSPTLANENADLRAQLQTLRGENALARDTAFWLDCRWKEPSDEPRSVDTCRLEGTHICSLCQLADLTQEKAALKAVVKAAQSWDHYGNLKVLHVLKCEECSRLEGSEGRWCATATELGRAQLAHAKALQGALAALAPRPRHEGKETVDG